MANKVLLVSPELSPYTKDSEISESVISKARELSAQNYEVRIFLPKYKYIKDRKYQLHEVIRLSGLNVEVNGVSQPIVLKVVTIPKGKIQVYFIDNEDYFKRDGLVYDSENNMFEDAGERSILYSRATLEVVKRLNWEPDTIILQGWMSYFSIPFLKDYFEKDETFKNSKIVLSYFKEDDFGRFFSDIDRILEKSSISNEFASLYKDCTYNSLLENTIRSCDLVLEENEELKRFHKINPSIFANRENYERDILYQENEFEGGGISNFVQG